MDFWASLEHKIYYKFEGNAPDYLEQELKACAEYGGYDWIIRCFPESGDHKDCGGTGEGEGSCESGERK